MRSSLVVGFTLVLAASSAVAQVQLTIRADGRKVITNFGGLPAARKSDWKWLARQHDRRSQYDPLIERYAGSYGVDPTLVRAVIVVESNYNPHCISNKGARGLMQLMPETAREYGIRSIFDPEENIRGGIRHLSEMLSAFPNDLPRALAAYNAGAGAVNRYRGIPPYAETATYVKRALTVYYGHPYGESGTVFGGGRNAKLGGGFMGAAIAPASALAAVR